MAIALCANYMLSINYSASCMHGPLSLYRLHVLTEKVVVLEKSVRQRLDCCIIEDINNSRETLKLRAIFQAFSGIIIKDATIKTASIA